MPILPNYGAQGVELGANVMTRLLAERAEASRQARQQANALFQKSLELYHAGDAEAANRALNLGRNAMLGGAPAISAKGDYFYDTNIFGGYLSPEWTRGQMRDTAALGSALGYPKGTIMQGAFPFNGSVTPLRAPAPAPPPKPQLPGPPKAMVINIPKALNPQLPDPPRPIPESTAYVPQNYIMPNTPPGRIKFNPMAPTEQMYTEFSAPPVYAPYQVGTINPPLTPRPLTAQNSSSIARYMVDPNVLIR